MQSNICKTNNSFADMQSTNKPTGIRKMAPVNIGAASSTPISVTLKCHIDAIGRTIAAYRVQTEKLAANARVANTKARFLSNSCIPPPLAGCETTFRTVR